jgi:hypothetical protein
MGGGVPEVETRRRCGGGTALGASASFERVLVLRSGWWRLRACGNRCSKIMIVGLHGERMRCEVVEFGAEWAKGPPMFVATAPITSEGTLRRVISRRPRRASRVARQAQLGKGVGTGDKVVCCGIRRRPKRRFSRFSLGGRAGV